MGVMSGDGWFVDDLLLKLYFHCLTSSMIAEGHR